MSHIAILIARPGSSALDEELALSCGTVLGSKPRWLGKEEACEFSLDQPISHDELSARLIDIINDRPVDLTSIPGTKRKKRAFIADMDSTMIGQECIDELGEELGIKDQIAGITARAMNGEIAFEPAVRERVALLKGIRVDAIPDIIERRITLAPGGSTLMATLRANGVYTALVSGGFTHFTQAVAEKLRFSEHRANVLEENEGALTGLVQEPILGAEAKVEALTDIAEKQGLNQNDFCAVGDGANDLPMLRTAGMGVALHGKPSVSAKAPIAINHGDLTSLLYLQGYQKKEFAET